MNRDRSRQCTVTLAAIVCAVGTLVGTGVIGTPVAQTSSGSLSDNATLVAPAGPAFTIWSVIYAGLAAYTVWQWAPSVTSSTRMRRTGWLAAMSMVLNASWLLVVQQDWIWASVAVILALLATLLDIVRRLQQNRPIGRFDVVVTDGTFGLYLGWVSVATVANVAAALTDSGVTVAPAVEVLFAVGVVVAVTVAGVVLARSFGGRWAVAAAMAWGFGWVAFGRLSGATESVPTAVAAIAGALVILAAAALFHRSRPPAADDFVGP
jgi:hypothetical protein